MNIFVLLVCMLTFCTQLVATLPRSVQYIRAVTPQATKKTVLPQLVKLNSLQKTEIARIDALISRLRKSKQRLSILFDVLIHKRTIGLEQRIRHMNNCIALLEHYKKALHDYHLNDVQDFVRKWQATISTALKALDISTLALKIKEENKFKFVLDHKPYVPCLPIEKQLAKPPRIEKHAGRALLTPPAIL